MQAAIATALQHQVSLSIRRGHLLSSANVFRRRLLPVPREALEGYIERCFVLLPDHVIV